MKTIKRIFITILLFVSYNAVTLSQNLDSMPVAERDSLLISIAKEVVLKYGPDYYREYKQPEIIKTEIPPNVDMTTTGEMAGRIVYVVTFLYDKTEEILDWGYAAKVFIMGCTGHPTRVMFGCGFGRILPEGDWRNDMTIEPVRYQDGTRAKHVHVTIMIPDSITESKAVEEFIKQAEKNINRDPANKDELISKGFVKNSDGQWVRTRPDVPPASAQRVIERAIEDMRRAKSENR